MTKANNLPLSMNTYPDNKFSCQVLIKIIKNEYVEDLLKGYLYMNPFKYFRNFEEKNTVGDDLEGIDSSYRAEDVIIKISNDKDELIPNGVFGRCNFHNNYVENSNLFSLSAFSFEKLPEGITKFFLDKNFREFKGDKAIVILDVPRFISKTQSAMESLKNIIQIPNEPFFIRHIDYVSDSYNGRLGVFRKLEKYQWQQELRIAIYRNVKKIKSKPYILKIGSIRSFSVVMDTEELISKGATINKQNR
ncbi:hypothetical protein [Legionella sp. PC997]|uniref:hypothetical protein n=1 Tax=Legionella sp. PC997 TaxID=2755562 RepID=UPI0015FB6A82|nr:hypothetical protein [Legionella sp. PC997]